MLAGIYFPDSGEILINGKPVTIRSPKVHPFGCIDTEDNYYYWGKAESERGPYASMILGYEYMAYNHSLDSKKVSKLFKLKE